MSAILDAVSALAAANTLRKQAMREPETTPPQPTRSGYPTGNIQPGQMFNAKGDVFSMPGQSNPVDTEAVNAIQAEKQGLIDANELAGHIPNMTLNAVVGLALDKQIADIEAQNPTAREMNPLAAEVRGRFSVPGQVFGARGYPQQPGIPVPNMFTRAVNAVFARDTQIPSNALFNAKGNRMTASGGASDFGVNEGFETQFGGGDAGGPTEGMSSFGGRESAVGQDDMSGYA